jgi:hypothetical protein
MLQPVGVSRPEQPRPANVRGEHVMLMAYSIAGNILPITREHDYKVWHILVLCACFYCCNNVVSMNQKGII